MIIIIVPFECWILTVTLTFVHELYLSMFNQNTTSLLASLVFHCQYTDQEVDTLLCMYWDACTESDLVITRVWGKGIKRNLLESLSIVCNFNLFMIILLHFSPSTSVTWTYINIGITSILRKTGLEMKISGTYPEWW